MVFGKLYPVVSFEEGSYTWDTIRELIAEDEHNSLERLMVKHPDIKQWKEILGIQEYAKDRKPYWNMLKTRDILLRKPS